MSDGSRETGDLRRCVICLLPISTTATAIQEKRLRSPLLPSSIVRANERNRTQTRQDRYFDCAELQLSAALGCLNCLNCAFFCQYASDLIRDKSPSGDFTENWRIYFGTGEESGDPCFVAWDFKDNGDWRHRTNFEIFSPGHSDHESVELKRVPAGDTSTDGAIQALRQWIDGCTRDHAHCPDADAVTKLPSRVLAISGEGSVPVVKLWETGGQRAQYICLSHCWGACKPACITYRGNLESQKNCVPWENFPKTFQEAIQVVRKLGHSYIWIDSVCIIQDDPQDWAVEASRMGSIYKHAFLTIAATAAPNSNVGLFTTLPDLYKARQLPGKDGQSPLFVRCPLPHSRDWEYYDGFESPLLSRGWVWQERLLSPRMS